MITYQMREKMRWSGREFRESRTFGDFTPPGGRAEELFDRYQLGRWSGDWSRDTLREVLGTLDLLDRVPRREIPAMRSVLDVGAKNWAYLGAIAGWVRRNRAQRSGEGLESLDPVRITGVELDAFRVYANLTTRVSNAHYHARACTDDEIICRYESGDVRWQQSRADVVTWFFPFVHRSTHLAWGLPRALYSPEELFLHVFTRCLRPGGLLVMANQGEWEWREAERMIGSRVPDCEGVELRSATVVEGSLHASPHPVFLTTWSKRP